MGASEEVAHPVPEHAEHERRAAQCHAAREVHVGNALEQVEPLRLAGDGLCDACTLFGGVTTEDEMFLLLGNYFVR